MEIFKSSTHSYSFVISFMGVITAFLFFDVTSHTDSEWITLFAMTGAVLLLNHHLIQLPPKGNTLSMDSSIYLANLFLYGLEFSMSILVCSSIIFAFTERRTKWQNHLLNFSFYSMMLVSSYYMFISTNGQVGNVNLTNLIPYISSLTVYFTVNTLLVGIFFLLSANENLVTVLKGMLKDTIATYLSMLLLSLVLLILIHGQNLFGLFLFICITYLLSQAFRQHFELYKEVAHKANIDDLTGLYNHGAFKEHLEKEVRIARETGQPLSVAILDIDDFKKYNDLYGHLQGDQLLKKFGNLLKKESEANHFLVARYGGEEFSLIMPNTPQSEAMTFVNQLRKKTNNTPFDGVQILPYGCLSFSGGIAEWEKETYDASELLNKADMAAYNAKDQGKNMVRIYSHQSDYSAQQSLNLENDIAEAEQQLKIFLSKDVYTYRHSKRVYQYAIDFSKKLQLNDQERKTLMLGALVHDIGKLEIPREILSKKGKLDPDEWAIMKKHVTWGKEIISTDKTHSDLIPLVELHHERYDGNGYPYGLKGDNIPKLARILCILDSFDAMTTERPYQKTKSFEEAIEELKNCAGTQFDPVLVAEFINMIKVNYSLKDCVEGLNQGTG
ncbi:diguanylate cyclase [Mesobacillus maritimus]|uniref:bifunctional diguanylate cyclase/phosphohydrolase n=1 Tax=Mesobacillus maritimus TaxID=1643336 RepID=UPI00203F997F|nr:diguanylate cyclase [Mesobacillus maritimus]MCM3668107.1 diguanylate cyclase [Mesobacillus maritimus]